LGDFWVGKGEQGGAGEGRTGAGEVVVLIADLVQGGLYERAATGGRELEWGQ
jgi:hypothetical protein